MWECHKFNTWNQQPGETIDQYVTDLKTKAQTCEFAQLKGSLIHDRIVCGIICDKTRARLLKESELTLQGALNICRANEATKSQLKTLSSNATLKETQEEVLAIQKRLVTNQNLYVTDVGITTTNTNSAQHKVRNVTTVVERITFLKCVEAVLLQSNERKSTLLHNMTALIPLTNYSFI